MATTTSPSPEIAMPQHTRLEQTLAPSLKYLIDTLRTYCLLVSYNASPHPHRAPPVFQSSTSLTYLLPALSNNTNRVTPGSMHRSMPYLFQEALPESLRSLAAGCRSCARVLEIFGERVEHPESSLAAEEAGVKVEDLEEGLEYLRSLLEEDDIISSLLRDIGLDLHNLYSPTPSHLLHSDDLSLATHMPWASDDAAMRNATPAATDEQEAGMAVGAATEGVHKCWSEARRDARMVLLRLGEVVRRLYISESSQVDGGRPPGHAGFDAAGGGEEGAYWMPMEQILGETKDQLVEIGRGADKVREWLKLVTG